MPFVTVQTVKYDSTDSEAWRESAHTHDCRCLLSSDAMQARNKRHVKAVNVADDVCYFPNGPSETGESQRLHIHPSRCQLKVSSDH